MSSEKVRDLLHLGKVSMNGLASILARLAAPSDAVSAKSLQRVNLELFNTVKKDLLVPRVGGGTISWEFLDLSKVLPAMLRVSEGLSTIYRHAMSKFPPSASRKWSLVIAFDEFAPGNKLKEFRWLVRS